jgi:hypothetical protein
MERERERDKEREREKEREKKVYRAKKALVCAHQGCNINYILAETKGFF